MGVPSPLRGVLLALGIATVVTMIMAAPVLLAPAERIFGSGRVLGVDDPDLDPLVVIGQFGGDAVAVPYRQPLTDVPGRLLARLVGPVRAYNVVVLATFPLAAAAAYLLARHVLGSHPGALVAALVYAFLPFHVTQAAGHPHVAQTQWLPLFLLALWRCVDRPGPARAAGLLAAAAAVALADLYAGFVAAVLSPVALLAYALCRPRPPDLRRRLALTTLVLVGAAVAGTGLVSRYAPGALDAARPLAADRADLFTWSAKWWSYLVPPVEHPLLGPHVRAFWSARGLDATRLEHQQVGVGLAVLLLAVVPVCAWLRGRRETGATRSTPVLVLLAGAAVFASLSPERSIGPLLFVRPSAWLYEVAPMFRAYARFGVVVGLMAAVLAGGGVAFLWGSRRGRWTAGALLGLVILENAPFPPWRWRDVLPTAAHRWLARQPGSLRVFDCVSSARTSDVLALRHLGHPASLAGRGGVEDCGAPGLGSALAAGGFTHAVVRRGSPAGEWLGRFPPGGLTRGPVFEDAWVMAVTGEPGPHVTALPGFHAREYDAERSWRWMAQGGALRIASSGFAAEAVLEVELRAFPHPRRVAWQVAGGGGGVLAVGTEWRRYALPVGSLRESALLSLACREPAVVAGDVLRSADRRRLAIALGQWRFLPARP